MAKAKSNESEKVSKDMEEVKECFVMMPFGDQTGYQPDHFKRVFEYLIRPACEEAGFVARRVDENSKTGIIVLEILNLILESKIAICDISSRNPNVFYELGLRQAFDKKCVIIKDNKTENPFDINMLRYVEYDQSLRIDLIQSKIHDLAKAISETAFNSEPDGNSIIHLLGIKQPAKIPDQKVMAPDMSILLNAINTLSAKFDNVRRDSIVRINRKSLVLPNGELVKLGDKIFKKGTGLINDEFGIIQNYSDQDVVLVQPNGNLISLPLDDKLLWEQLTTNELSI